MLFGPALRERIRREAEFIVHPPVSCSPGERDPFCMFRFIFTCRAEDGQRLGCAETLTAHGLLSANLDALGYIEEAAERRLADAGGRTAGTKLEVLLTSMGGRQMRI